MKIVLDPRNRMLYASYYIYGMRKVAGRRNVGYSLKPFKDLERRKEESSFDHYMAFVVNEGGEDIKIVIDYWDLRGISNEAYQWCDVYAKINIPFDVNMEDYPKLYSIPPGYGIRADNIFTVGWLCVANYLRCHCNPLKSLRSHLYDYYASYRGKEPLTYYYSKDDNKSKYVFLVSTLWPHDNCKKTTNPLRLAFMKTCINNPEVEFEGGFYVMGGDAPEEFRELSFTKMVPKQEYLKKIKRSVVVFNTPAVHDCHGWKLGEYLAMGKCIISTPISNRLPAELIDHKHIFVVNNPDEMKDAVTILLNDKKFREEMSLNSYDYYTKYVEPSALFRNVLAFYKSRKESQ